jgi:hypothetical protein
MGFTTKHGWQISTHNFFVGATSWKGTYSMSAVSLLTRWVILLNSILKIELSEEVELAHLHNTERYTDSS